MNPADAPTSSTGQFDADFIGRLLDGFDESIIVVDRDERVIRSCSDSVERMFGYRPNELIGRTTEILHVDHESFVAFGESYWREIHLRRTFRLRHRMRHRNGRVFETLHYVAPLFDASGRVSGSIGVIRDVSEVTSKNRLLDLIINSVPVAISIARIDDGQLLLANRTCRDALGLPPGADLTDVRFPDFYADAAQRGPLLDALLRDGSVNGASVRLRRRDGTLFWVSTSLQIIRIGGEKLIFGSFIDNTAEREAREAADRARRNLEAIIDNAPAVIYLKDRDRHYILQNRRMREERAIAGLDTSEERSYTRHPPEVAARLVQLDSQVLDAGIAVTDEFTTTVPDGKAHRLKIVKFPVFDENGTVTAIGGFSLDVTEQHELEERLRHAQKMESVGQLSGGIAHDFNNLLEVILGNSEMLIEDLAGDPARRRMAELVQKAAERAAALTHRMLAFSRQQDLHPDSADCGRLIASLLKMLKRTLGEDIELVGEFAPELWHVWVDRGELEASLINLTVNARDAMPSGGPIRVRTENVTVCTIDSSPADELPSGDYVRITVADSGVGMPPDVLARAFDPYFTTKEVGKGTGLGLSMVHGFVRQSGGHVAIESAVGQGTTVMIYLPRFQNAALPAERDEPADPAIPEPASRAEEPSSPPARATLPTGTETVLVVEDEPMVRAYVAAELDRLGYRVIEARDGREALAALRADAAIGLLFTDMVMPGGMRGNELARQARAIRPGLKVLFTTGYANAFDGKALPGDEQITVLHKPYPRRELAEYVRRCLDAA